MRLAFATLATASVLTVAAWYVTEGHAARSWPRPPAWFRAEVACIGLHESGNGAQSSNLYGMLDGWTVAGGRGSAAEASPAEQQYRAWRLYLWARKRYGDGWAPWKCCPGTARACGY